MYTSLVAFGAALGLAGLASLAHAQPADPAQPADRGASARHHVDSPMVRKVRQATATFRNVDNAVAAGYESSGTCVSGPSGGAMGVHYANPSLLGDGELDVTQPEVLVYEPGSDGRLRLVAAEYVTFAEQWEAKHSGEPASLEGHHFNRLGATNRAGLPPHWELHVWAWKPNPRGTFADYNPIVSCEAFVPAP